MRRIEWKGEGLAEKGVDGQSGKILVEVDARYFRPTEVDVLVGDASKARARLGWRHTVLSTATRPSFITPTSC